MNDTCILKNKLLLLRWTANQNDEDFVYDKEFDDKIRTIYTQLSSPNADKLGINNQIKVFFDIYYLGLVRALLSNIHFLHLTSSLEHLFEDLFEKIREYHQQNNLEYDLLIRELEFFSSSKISVIEDFIVVLLKKLQISEIQTESIFKNDNYNDQFKLFLFKSYCSSPNHIRVLLEYFINYSTNKPYLTYNIDSLIDVYSKNTGKLGFDLATIKYKVKAISDINGISFHGTKLIAAFEENIVDLLIQFREKPIKILIEPIVLSISNMTLENKNKSLLILLNEWGKDTEVLRLIREAIVFQMITNDRFTSQISNNARNAIYTKICLFHSEKNQIDLIAELRSLHNQKNRNAIESIIDNATGQTFFYCLMVPNSEFCFDIFKYILKFSKRYKPWDKRHTNKYNQLKTFRNHIYNPEYFQKLPQRIKHALVSVHPLIKFMGYYKNTKDINSELETRFKNIELYCNPNTRNKVWEFINSKV